VATVPEVVPKLAKLGFSVIVQSGRGRGGEHRRRGLRGGRREGRSRCRPVWSGADIVFKVRAPPRGGAGDARGPDPRELHLAGAEPELLQALAAKKATVLAMDSVPRISRAQKLDALSSMANIGGYRAVIEAAHHFGRFFTGQITAAGKVPPAKVFVIGAGVRGPRRDRRGRGLGAIVRANDTRPEVADQIQSLGGEFVPVDYVEEGAGVGGYAKVMSEGFQKAQRETFAKQAKEVDIIITTALIPGKPAPKLITAEMVQSMKPGSVIVDMAAEQGGNCELTEPGRWSSSTASPSSATPTCEPARDPGEHALRDQPLPPLRGPQQGEGRRLQRQHGDEVIRGTTVSRRARSPGRRPRPSSPLRRSPRRSLRCRPRRR
jgi:NAD(P) transhydrogenase subunit alpha